MIDQNKRIHTIEKLKKMLREYEGEEELIKNMTEKRVIAANNLKTNLKMINDKPSNQFDAISNSIQKWIESTKIEMETTQNAIEELSLSANKDLIRKMHFSEKVHIYRESLLSIMFHNDKNYKTLYYMILNLFLYLLLWVLISDYKKTGNIIDVEFWVNTFSGLPIIMGYWLCIFICSFSIVFYVKLIQWYSQTYNKINYYLFFLGYLAMQFFIYFFVFYKLSQHQFKIPCNLIISIEMARISMKIHGYFREKILYGLKEFHMKYANYSYKSHEQMNNSISDIKINDLESELKRFLYYMVCPSLIYRDNYPRLPHYRFSKIISHFSNFTLCILFYYILMRYICDPYFNFSKIKDYYSLAHFLFDSLRFAIPAVSFLVVGFFLLLHTWMNLWSELLRHGDRRFYEDWWNCTNFEEYYRKWNMVVHEWLYYYVYNEVIRLSLGRLNRHHAKFAVFLLSVIIHELIVWQALGFFFPILSLFFGGPGIIFAYIKTKGRKFNLMFWFKLFLGTGLILVLYLREVNMRRILDDLGLISSWHEWIPRSMLMYLSDYKELIQKSRFY